MRKEEGLGRRQTRQNNGNKLLYFPCTWTLEIHMITYDIEEDGGYLARGRALVRVRPMVVEGTEANVTKKLIKRCRE